jgi:hypothetical protein
MQKKKMTRAEKMKVPLNPELKMRVLKAKLELPPYGLTTLFFHYFPDFKETRKNKSSLTNVLQIRKTDLRITIMLEELVLKLDNSK